MKTGSAQSVRNKNYSNNLLHRKLLDAGYIWNLEKRITHYFYDNIYTSFKF